MADREKVTLTQEQRAKRRAVRRNNRIRRDYPLLAAAGVIDDWMTTPEAELEVVQEHDVRFLAGMRWGIERQAETLRRALCLRDLARMYLSAEEYQEQLAYRKRVYPANPVYELEMWKSVLGFCSRFDAESGRVVEVMNE